MKTDDDRDRKRKRSASPLAYGGGITLLAVFASIIAVPLLIGAFAGSRIATLLYVVLLGSATLVFALYFVAVHANKLGPESTALRRTRLIAITTFAGTFAFVAWNLGPDGFDEVSGFGRPSRLLLPVVLLLQSLNVAGLPNRR